MTNPILKDGERIDQLFSTDVKIIQNKEVFSYSIDSVLLSRFPKIPKKGLIVDLCSGNGAVGLFASTRTEAPITLVELQAVSYTHLDVYKRQAVTSAAPARKSLAFTGTPESCVGPL